MLRSFVTLADTLNLSKAVKVLGSTRQTVRRHIDILEEIRGRRLFDIIDRQYRLTETGTRSLIEATALVARGDAWLAGNIQNISGLERIGHQFEQDQSFHSQQQHLSRLWTDGTALLQNGFLCWAKAGGFIEDPALAPIRPHLLVYRLHRHGWQCVELGEKSVYAFWFGWKWVKSNVGQIVGDNLFGARFAESILQTYQEVYESGGVRLDHIHRVSSRGTAEPTLASSYQRLLLGSTFPNGEYALIVLTDLTQNVKITDLDGKKFGVMSTSLLSEYQSMAGILEK